MSGTGDGHFKSGVDATAVVHMTIGELDTLVSGKVAEAIAAYEQARNQAQFGPGGNLTSSTLSVFLLFKS